MKQSNDMKSSKQTPLDGDSMSEIRTDALKDFQDPEHRHAYCDEFLDISIATQIKVLREQRTLTQSELAAKAEMKQSRISALEDVNYSSWSINTLRRLARAFDVTLTVKFESFGKKLSTIETFSRAELEVPKFADDSDFLAKSDKSYVVGDSIWAELIATPQETAPAASPEPADTESIFAEPARIPPGQLTSVTNNNFDLAA